MTQLDTGLILHVCFPTGDEWVQLEGGARTPGPCRHQNDHALFTPVPSAPSRCRGVDEQDWQWTPNEH